MWTAQVLKSARRRAGLSQRELAARAGVPYSTVGRIEAGSIDPRASTLRALLRPCGEDLETMPALGVGVDLSQIRERLQLSALERLRDLAAAAAAIDRIRRAPRSS